MSLEMIALLALAGVVGIVIVITVIIRMPKKLKPTYFVVRWNEIQSFCRNKADWPKAIEEADKLLLQALKKRKFRGKSMGERMVSAQRVFTDNDGIWYAHNLCKKILAEDSFRLRENDVRDALIGYRQALRDLGALPHGQSRDS